MFTVLNFGPTHMVMFTALGHFQSSYKVKFGHLYSVKLTILCSTVKIGVSFSNILNSIFEHLVFTKMSCVMNLFIFVHVKSQLYIRPTTTTKEIPTEVLTTFWVLIEFWKFAWSLNQTNFLTFILEPQFSWRNNQAFFLLPYSTLRRHFFGVSTFWRCVSGGK